MGEEESIVKKERCKVHVATEVDGCRFAVETTVIAVDRMKGTVTLRLDDERDELPTVGKLVELQWAETEGETAAGEAL